jgi:DNA-binding response OmpR family regulator
VQGELVLIGDGDRAIRYISALDWEPVACPDLVILDLNLPKRSGHEVLQSMGQHEKCRDARVVILSSSDAQQDRAAAIGLGASGYIRKPLRLEEFLSLGAVFREMLERS